MLKKILLLAFATPLILVGCSSSDKGRYSIDDDLAPAKPIAQDRRDEVADEGADVDTHVKDVVTRVLEWAAVLVQSPDDGTDVRLEETVAHDDQQQGEVEEGLARQQAQTEIAGSHQ